jgi:hypothetical protein
MNFEENKNSLRSSTVFILDEHLVNHLAHLVIVRVMGEKKGVSK